MRSNVPPARRGKNNSSSKACGAVSIAMQNEVTSDVRNAAAQVASQRHFKLIVTRQFVGYGGIDITPDVEKILKITETASPAP